MSERDRIMTVGVLSERELAVVAQSLRRVYSVEETPTFDDLLHAIDRGDAQRGGIVRA